MYIRITGEYYGVVWSSFVNTLGWVDGGRKGAHVLFDF